MLLIFRLSLIRRHFAIIDAVIDMMMPPIFAAAAMLSMPLIRC